MKRLNKSEMLHSAIHQMTQSEKRLFRMEINKLKKNSDYSKVFDYMSNIKFFDEQKFKSYLKKNKITSTHTTISYLFDKLITFLTLHRPSLSRFPKIRYEIEKTAALSETMYELGFIRQAHKIRKKAYKLALEHNQYDLAAYNFFLLFATERQHSILELPSVESSEKAAETNFGDLAKLWSIKMQLQIMSQKAVDFSSDINTTEEDWKSIIENPIFSLDIYEFGFVSKILALKIKSSYHLWNLEYEKSIKLTNEIITFYREDKEKFVDFFENFLIAHTNLSSYLYYTKHVDLKKHAVKFEELLNEFEELAVDISNDRMRNIYTYHEVLNSCVQLRTILLQESFTIQEVNKWSLTEKTVKKPWTAAIISMLLSAYMYLLLKQYDKLQHYIDMIKNTVSPHSFPQLEWELTLLSLIADFEDNANVYFQNQLKNALRRSKYKGTAPKTIVYILHLLGKLRRARYPQKVLKAALPEITALEPQRYTKLHFSIWVRWQLEE